MPKRSLLRWDLLRWIGGILATAVLYFLRRVPTYRRNREHRDAGEFPDASRPLPGDQEALQRVADGVGPLFHRHYWIDFTDSEETPESIIRRVSRDLNEFAPQGISHIDGEGMKGPDPLQVGDEIVVRIAGPWDGPVRVIDRTETSFRFATLKGHMEAGEIEFRAGWEERGFLRFEIESWARSGDETFDFLYSRIPFASEAQLYMWAVFCERVAKLAGGVVMSSVQVHTDRREME